MLLMQNSLKKTKKIKNKISAGEFDNQEPGIPIWFAS